MKKGVKHTRLAIAAAIALAVPGFHGPAGGADLLASADWNGSLNLVLDNAVRIRVQGQAVRSDLRVTFLCRNGRWDGRAWAWFERMPALEHPVTLCGAEGDEETLRLDFDVAFTSHAPVFAGGSGGYSVELRRALGVIRGDFTGRLGPVAGDVSTNLWSVYRGYALGSTQKPEWPMAIDPGRVCSLGRPGATVRATRSPLPAAVTGHVPVAPGEHPRLLLRAREVGPLADRLASAGGTDIAAGLDAVLSNPRGEWWNCAGSEAAGWATLWLARRDASLADKAAACARDAAAVMRDKPHSMAYGRNLAGLALAYDLCADQWPSEFRTNVCAELARAAVRVAACLPQATKSETLLAPGQLFDGLASPSDYRFGYLRAAAGLALLAVEGDRACDVAPERLVAADAAISGSITRLLRDGIGEHGEGTGNHGFADLVEVLLPYLQAYRSVRGIDLAAGTGVERLGLLGVTTRGFCFLRGSEYPAGAWVPFVLPFASGDDAGPVRAFAAKSERRFRDPWHGAVSAVNWPQEGAASVVTNALPAVIEDSSMGSYVLGAAADSDRFAYLRGAAGPDQAGALHGDVSVYALGRAWIAPHAATPGDFSWPRSRDCNTLNLVHESKAGQKVAIVPRSAGYIEGIRFDHSRSVFDGSGSVCMRADPEGMPAGRARRGLEAFGFEGGGAVGGSAWRTVGVDFSGASGAAVLLVMVDGCSLGGVEADRYWEMDAGPVPADRVVTGPGVFSIRPEGTNASMQGVFIYPAVVDVGYVPPNGTRGGRIRAFLNRKATSKDLSLDHSIRTKAFGSDVEADLRTVDEVRGDERNEQFRQRMASVIAEILRRESYSAGSPEQIATNTCVVVITVQRGDAPPVEPALRPGGPIVAVGGQTVFYRDSAITFGTSALKSGE